MATVRDINAALDGSTLATSALGVLTSVDYLQVVRSLAGLEEHLRNFEPDRGVVTRRAVAAPPRATTTRTTLLTVAHQLLNSSPETVVAHIRESLDRHTLGASTRLTWLRDRTIALPALAPILEEAAQGSASVGNRRMVTGSDRDASVRHLPQLTWSEVWDDLKPMTESGEVVGRGFASLAVAKYILRCTWQAAGAVLQLPRYVTTKLARSGHQALLVDDAAYFEALKQSLMERLMGSPDYRVREDRFRACLLDENWMSMARNAVGVSPAFDAVLRQHVWHDFVQGHPATTPANAEFDRAERSRLAVQKRRWTNHQTALLFAHLIADEPEGPATSDVAHLGPAQRGSGSKRLRLNQPTRRKDLR